MLHHNHAPHPLNFKLRGVAYSVAPGEEIDIPSRYAYAVPSTLRPVPGAVCEAPVDDADVEVWKARARAAVARAERAESAIGRAEEGERQAVETLAQEREARDGFVAALRDALAIGPGDSIITAIKALRDAAEEAATAPPPVRAPGQPKHGGSR